MNLAHHAKLLWRFRFVTAVGLGLAIALAVLASYQVSWDGKPSFTPRGSETWQSDSSLLVTQPGFPEGRVTLPTGAINGPVDEPGGSSQPPAGGAQQTARGRGQIEFAPPDRFSSLASLYVALANSDQVRSRLRPRVAPERIQVEQVPGPPGQLQLPVLRLKTLAPTAAGARVLNTEVVNALREVIAGQQAQNEVPVARRVRLSVINAPSAPILESGRSRTSSILAALLCLIGTLALVHLLAAVRGSAPARTPTDDFAARTYAWEAPGAPPADLGARKDPGPRQPVEQRAP